MADVLDDGSRGFCFREGALDWSSSAHLLVLAAAPAFRPRNAGLLHPDSLRCNPGNKKTARHGLSPCCPVTLAGT